MARPNYTRYSQRSTKTQAKGKKGGGTRVRYKNPAGSKQPTGMGDLRAYEAQQRAAAEAAAERKREEMRGETRTRTAEEMYADFPDPNSPSWRYAQPGTSFSQMYQRERGYAYPMNRTEEQMYADFAEPDVWITAQQEARERRGQRPQTQTQTTLPDTIQGQQARFAGYGGNKPAGGWIQYYLNNPQGPFNLLLRGMEGPPSPVESPYQDQGYGDYGDWYGGGGWGYGDGGGAYTPAEPEIPTWLYGLINWRV